MKSTNEKAARWSTFSQNKLKMCVMKNERKSIEDANEIEWKCVDGRIGRDGQERVKQR